MPTRATCSRSGLPRRSRARSASGSAGSPRRPAGPSRQETPAWLNGSTVCVGGQGRAGASDSFPASRTELKGFGSLGTVAAPADGVQIRRRWRLRASPARTSFGRLSSLTSRSPPTARPPSTAGGRSRAARTGAALAGPADAEGARSRSRPGITTPGPASRRTGDAPLPLDAFGPVPALAVAARRRGAGPARRVRGGVGGAEWSPDGRRAGARGERRRAFPDRRQGQPDRAAHQGSELAARPRGIRDQFTSLWVVPARAASRNAHRARLRGRAGLLVAGRRHGSVRRRPPSRGGHARRAAALDARRFRRPAHPDRRAQRRDRRRRLVSGGTLAFLGLDAAKPAAGRTSVSG